MKYADNLHTTSDTQFTVPIRIYLPVTVDMKLPDSFNEDFCPVYATIFMFCALLCISLLSKTTAPFSVTDYHTYH